MVWIGSIITTALTAALTYMCWLHTVTLNPGKADALIILGYVSRDGRIHPLLKERLDEACKIFQQYGHENIIVSGGAVGSRYSEADLMKEYLVEKGIPANKVLKEDQSRNTVQNLIYSKRLMELHQLESFIVITSLFHIRRTKYIMHRLGMKGSFYAKRSLRSIIALQLKLTFLEIRAFRLTLPIIRREVNNQNSVQKG